ncbi:MAG: chromate transporter [Ruminococcaceae bacterium]|nr:chromate transporter [Oscillospiraceae bacterium]
MKLTKDKLKKCLQLFLTFFKIGAFTFGGGVAMIPFMEREVVEKKKWIDKDVLLDIVVVAESTPGPIAINGATFIGYKVAGFMGSMCATLGVVLPSFIIILLLSFCLGYVWENEIVQYALRGIRAGVLALVAKSLWGLFKKSPANAFSYIMIALSFIAVAVFDVKVLIVIISGALIGLAAFFISKKAGDNKK